MSCILNLVRENIMQMTAYESARSLNTSGSLFLDANELPWDSSKQELNRYPAPRPKQLLSQLAEYYKVKEEQVFSGRGSDEAIDSLIRAFCEPASGGIITCPPTYGMYQVSAQIQGVRNLQIPLILQSDDSFQLNTEEILTQIDADTHLVFVCSPNNPTGNILKKQDILNLCESLEGKALVVVDEAYIEFSDQASLTECIDQFSNLVVLRTLSKAHGLAGLRAGFAFAQKDIIHCLNKVRAPYPMPQPVITALQNYFQELLAGEEKNNLDENIKNIVDEKQKILRTLQELPSVVRVFASDANFLLVQFVETLPVFEAARCEGIVLRDRSDQALLKNCIRISIGTAEQNDTLLKFLKNQRVK